MDTGQILSHAVAAGVGGLVTYVLIVLGIVKTGK